MLPLEEVLEEPFGIGRLLPDHLIVAAPAAGAGAIFKLDSRWQWRFQSVRFSLATDANVANRFVSVDYCDPEGNVWIRNAAAVVVTAGTAAQEYSFDGGRAVSEWAANTPVLAPLNRTFVPGGWQLRVNVANVQVGDQLTAVDLYVVQYEPDR